MTVSYYVDSYKTAIEGTLYQSQTTYSMDINLKRLDEHLSLRALFLSYFSLSTMETICETHKKTGATIRVGFNDDGFVDSINNINVVTVHMVPGPQGNGKKTMTQTWTDIEVEIAKAVAAGILVDKRRIMPRGRCKSGNIRKWKKRTDPSDVLGCCIHQSAGRTTDDPTRTARYHTSVHNHITPGRELPSLCYLIAIPDDGGPPWLCGDLDWIVYGQGASDDKGFPGEENRHLIPVLVQGAFDGPGYHRDYARIGPSQDQLYHLGKVIDWLQKIFAFSDSGIFGHYHFGKAACPGTVLMSEIEKTRGMLDRYTLGTFQRLLLRWNSGCLPQWGADGLWGNETQSAVVKFQLGHGLKMTGQMDPFTQLLLTKRYQTPEPVECTCECPCPKCKGLESGSR